MVQRIYDVSDVFAHIAVDIPFPGEQFRRLIDQVGRKNGIQDPLFVSLVELLKSAFVAC